LSAFGFDVDRGAIARSLLGEKGHGTAASDVVVT
jgi:hypothetical protein